MTKPVVVAVMLALLSCSRPLRWRKRRASWQPEGWRDRASRPTSPALISLETKRLRRLRVEQRHCRLDAYIGQCVTIYGAPAPGYKSGQVEGGPPPVDVTGVKPVLFYESLPGLRLRASVSLTCGRCIGSQ